MKISNEKKLDFKINHRNWEEALANAFALLISTNPGEVVCIVGPSRAGKTRLIHELCRLLFGVDVFNSNAHMPAVIVDAENTGPNGTFSTKDFILRILEAIRHPLVSIGAEEGGVESIYQKFDRIAERTLRSILEKGLIFRGVRYLFIDEAQHVKYVSRDAVGAYAVMDSWKCLAKSANIVLVVVGAYPVLEILEKSPHLLGRKHQVHLPRYLLTESDLLEFSCIVKSYELHVIISPKLGSLNNCIEILYEYSLGCIGLLRGWLMRASAMASVAGGGITKEILMEMRLSDSDLASISKEILLGEQSLLKNPHGSSDKKTRPTPPPDKSKSGKPFQRNPRRMEEGNRLRNKK